MRDDGIQSVRTVGAQVKKLPSRPEGWAFERGSVDELLSRPGHSCAGSHARDSRGREAPRRLAGTMNPEASGRHLTFLDVVYQY